MMLFHATAVVIDGRAVLLAGPSGAGKSDLALRLIDRGAKLLADDYIELEARGSKLIAHAPTTIEGRLEVRGLGIITTEFIRQAPVALLVDLDRTPERLPDPATQDLAGIAIPVIALSAFEMSGPVKIELALSGRVLPLE